MKILQRVFLVIGIVSLLALIAELVFSVLATTHGDTPARIATTNAGPYQLIVKLYKDPPNAGFALPFAIAPQQKIDGTLTYEVNSEPVDPKTTVATPVRAAITPDSTVPNGIQGTAEISVQGAWRLLITVSGPQGKFTGEVQITATAPPALPLWIGWPLGLIPLATLIVFLVLQRSKKQPAKQLAEQNEVPVAL